MKKTDEKYAAYVSILEEELMVAMGCTEPIAIALAAARARELLGEVPERLKVEASGSIIKNAKSVVVPHTGGLKGIEAAVAAGVIAGQASNLLEVISQVGEEEIQNIAVYLHDTPIDITRSESGLDFDLVVYAEAATHTASVRIAEYHTNIVHEECNGDVLLDVPLDHEGDTYVGLTDRSLLSVEDIWDFANTVDLADVHDLFARQIDYNYHIAEEGIQNSWGANIGSVMLNTYGTDIKVRACAMAAAASDARMSGCELPVVINSGSGNQGIASSVPIIEYARELGASEEKLYRALVLSALITAHLKTGIGRLSAFCGAVCAGAAAGAGIAYLEGGGYDDAVHTLVNALSITAGIICDGAKPSCAAKIAFAVNAGILGHNMYKSGQQFYAGEGIVKQGVESTIQSVCRVGREGMRSTNDEIIDIMLGSPGC